MEERIPSLDIDFQIRLLTEEDFDKLSSFSCGEPELDYFFQKEVRECVKYRYLSAYCAFIESGEIIAAFTLMNDALMIKDTIAKEDFITDVRFITNEDIVKFFILQTSYPAINIGHLGTSKEYQRRGVGTAIIDLVAETFSQDTRTGCQFITVDSLNNPDTNKFYLKNNFYNQTDADASSPTRRMYRIIIDPNNLTKSF